ncbi:Legumain [Aphelenchoides fujianensis]|nr:Legumain [Aphelenchoides fujianensis]
MCIQAEQSRLYHQLIERGVKAENIVVIMNEEVVFSEPANPWPGKLYDSPDRAHEWFEGVKVDYSGEDITAKNYLAGLTGHKEDLSLVEGSSSTGRVLQTGPNDRLFVFHFSHGEPGRVLLADGYLYAKDLHEAFERMQREQKFKELFYVIHACYSGSMFANALSIEGSIYAITSANATEEATFNDCQPVESRNRTFRMCFNDPFGQVFFNSTQSKNAGNQTLEQQYEFIRDHIISDYAPSQGSHAQQFGSRQVAEEKAAKFEGEQQPAANRKLRSAVASPVVVGNGRVMGKIGAYFHVQEALNKAQDLKEIHELQRELEQFEQERSDTNEQAVVLSAQPATIDDFGCHRDVLKQMDAKCPQISKGTFATDFIAVLTKLVNRRVDCGRLVAAVSEVCR